MRNFTYAHAVKKDKVISVPKQQKSN